LKKQLNLLKAFDSKKSVVMEEKEIFLEFFMYCNPRMYRGKRFKQAIRSLYEDCIKDKRVSILKKQDNRYERCKLKIKSWINGAPTLKFQPFDETPRSSQWKIYIEKGKYSRTVFQYYNPNLKKNEKQEKQDEKEEKQDVVAKFNEQFLFARVPGKANIFKSGDPLEGLPTLYLTTYMNATSMRSEYTTTKSFLCCIVTNDQEEDSIVVNDIFKSKGYYIDTEEYYKKKKKIC
jgi:hypothetical protein